MGIQSDIGIYKRAISQRKPAGGLLIGNTHIADTLQCKHCGKHWVPIRGSRKLRGWCLRCNGVLCGNRDCLLDCSPFEEKLEMREKNANFKT